VFQRCFFATCLKKGIQDYIARVPIIRVYGSPHSRDSYHLPIPSIWVDAGRFGCGPEAALRRPGGFKYYGISWQGVGR